MATDGAGVFTLVEGRCTDMDSHGPRNGHALIILHEIYGVNEFVLGERRRYEEAGFDVFCPNLLGRPSFRYEESREAYDNFVAVVGFDVHKRVEDLAAQLGRCHRKVFVLGFSVGATIAWRCSGSSFCDGVVGCYGSRIRDYVDVAPTCPTLLLFAQRDSFDVDSLVGRLEGRPRLSVRRFDACHGFMDPFSRGYDALQARQAQTAIARFLAAL